MAKTDSEIADLNDADLMKIIKKACDEFEGDFTHLEAALGALLVGRVVGWKGLRLMHTGRTFKRYEEILKLTFRDVLPALTSQSERLHGIRAMKRIGAFWQVVSSGLVPASKAAMGHAKK